MRRIEQKAICGKEKWSGNETSVASCLMQRKLNCFSAFHDSFKLCSITEVKYLYMFTTSMQSNPSWQWSWLGFLASQCPLALAGPVASSRVSRHCPPPSLFYLRLSLNPWCWKCCLSAPERFSMNQCIIYDVLDLDVSVSQKAVFKVCSPNWTSGHC